MGMQWTMHGGGGWPAVGVCPALPGLVRGDAAVAVRVVLRSWGAGRWDRAHCGYGWVSWCPSVSSQAMDCSVSGPSAVRSKIGVMLAAPSGASGWCR